ncbi:MAG: hypothetical protein DRO76_00450 [Candidatus Altiarchaeales archaeon]|nr:MAG: hypothetical protein DRO76_00450 [Candidatus Altiarchaeales archaeon]
MKNKAIKLVSFVAIALILSTSSSAMGERAMNQERIELGWRTIFIDIMHWVVSNIMGIYDDLEDFILWNPPLGHENISRILNSVIGILQPLYVTAILITGIYLIFLSGSIKGRIYARNLLPRLIISMFVVSLSFVILQLLFNISYSITEEILKRSPVGITQIFSDVTKQSMLLFDSATLVSLEAGHIFFLLIFTITLGPFIILALRYLILVLFTLIFPISIFLYTFNFSRPAGRIMLEQTLIWTFMQVVFATLIVITNLGISVMGLHGDLRIIAGIIVFLLIVISPLIILFLIRRFLP